MWAEGVANQLSGCGRRGGGGEAAMRHVASGIFKVFAAC